MMRLAAAICVLALLGACGVDGAPSRPQPKQEELGPGFHVTLTGSVGVGVSGGDSRLKLGD